MLSLSSKSRLIASSQAGARRLFHQSLSPSSWNTPVRLTSDGLQVQLTPNRAPDTFPYAWLRDSDPGLLHASTRQKLHASMDVPTDAPVEARFIEDDSKLEITWPTSTNAATKKAEVWPSVSHFPIDFLLRHVDKSRASDFHGDFGPVVWTKEKLLQSRTLAPTYDELVNDKLVRSYAMEQLVRYGIIFVRDMPSEETSDDKAEVSKLAGIFGEMHETFYGRMWDVESKGETSTNIAYTHLDLGLHMDLEYFEHPPRYQILHMLRNRNVIGGESIFSDALHAAETMRVELPELFHALATSPVGFQYINDGHHQYWEHTTIELGQNGQVAYINYSPPFQSPLPLETARNPLFLPALARFRALLESPERLFERKLEEGHAVIFDNRRVLHGRRNIDREPGKAASSGIRLLKGCYIQADSTLDRLRASVADRKV